MFCRNCINNLVYRYVLVKVGVYDEYENLILLKVYKYITGIIVIVIMIISINLFVYMGS